MKRIFLISGIVIILLSAGFYLFRYITYLKKQIASFENKKKSFSQTLTKYEDGLVDAMDRLIRLEESYIEKDQKIKELIDKNALISAENIVLKKQVSSLAMEKEDLISRLNSVPELKKIIKNLKKRKLRVEKALDRQFKLKRVFLGNRGYLTKNGRPTYPAAVSIKVEPVIE